MSGLLASVLEDGGEELERSLRPGTLEDFVGQERVKEQLAIALGAAKARGEAITSPPSMAQPSARSM